MSLTDIFNTNSSGETALMHAVKNSDVAMAKKLLDLGGHVNITPPPDLPKPKRAGPPAPKARLSAKDVTTMATDRDVVAPATARFKKKPQKRKTTL